MKQDSFDTGEEATPHATVIGSSSVFLVDRLPKEINENDSVKSREGYQQAESLFIGIIRNRSPSPERLEQLIM